MRLILTCSLRSSFSLLGRLGGSLRAAGHGARMQFVEWKVTRTWPCSCFKSPRESTTLPSLNHNQSDHAPCLGTKRSQPPHSYTRWCSMASSTLAVRVSLGPQPRRGPARHVRCSGPAHSLSQSPAAYSPPPNATRVSGVLAVATSFPLKRSPVHCDAAKPHTPILATRSA